MIELGNALFKEISNEIPNLKMERQAINGISRMLIKKTNMPRPDKSFRRYGIDLEYGHIYTYTVAQHIQLKYSIKLKPPTDPTFTTKYLIDQFKIMLDNLDNLAATTTHNEHELKKFHKLNNKLLEHQTPIKVTLCYINTSEIEQILIIYPYIKQLERVKWITDDHITYGQVNSNGEILGYLTPQL